MQLRTRVIGAAGIAAVVAAGGSAFTAGITGGPTANNIVGSTGAVIVQGANLDTLQYTLSGNEEYVASAKLTLSEDLGNGANVTYKVGTTSQVPGIGACVIETARTVTCTFGPYVPMVEGEGGHAAVPAEVPAGTATGVDFIVQ